VATSKPGSMDGSTRCLLRRCGDSCRNCECPVLGTRDGTVSESVKVKSKPHKTVWIVDKKRSCGVVLLWSCSLIVVIVVLDYGLGDAFQCVKVRDVSGTIKRASRGTNTHLRGGQWKWATMAQRRALATLEKRCIVTPLCKTTCRVGIASFK
jgi:hypothetical protein